MQTKHTSLFSRFGFTMIELLVAATILAVLAAVGMVSYASANRRARDGKRKGDLEQMRSALELYRSDSTVSGGTYYTSSASPWDAVVTTLNTNDYLSSPTLTDPKNQAPYTYVYTTSDGGKTYEICATLEGTGTPTSYCLDNP